MATKATTIVHLHRRCLVQLQNTSLWEELTDNDREGCDDWRRQYFASAGNAELGLIVRYDWSQGFVLTGRGCCQSLDKIGRVLGALTELDMVEVDGSHRGCR